MFDWEEKPELNITPLVDIMLVLVAILMLTTPVIVYEELIRLPDGSRQVKQSSGQQNIEIRIDRKRNVYLNDQTFQLEAFPDSFMLFAASLPTRDQKVSIRADERLSYKDVMAVLKTVKAAKFTRIALLTDG